MRITRLASMLLVTGLLAIAFCLTPVSASAKGTGTATSQPCKHKHKPGTSATSFHQKAQ
jgi:hypothetical protein